MMRTQKRLTEIANLLWDNGYNGRICFDHKSYDFEGDIPRIKVGGKIVLVSEFIINRPADIISVVGSNGDFFSLCINSISNEWDDDYYESIGLFELLQYVYYETKESFDIGDYELDFINH